MGRVAVSDHIQGELDLMPLSESLGRRAAVVAGRVVRGKKPSLGALSRREKERIATSKVVKFKKKKPKAPDTRSGFQRLEDSLEGKLFQ